MPSTTEAPPKQLVGNNSGHGSGYDGKLIPGLFVKEDKNKTCYLDDGEATHVEAMIRIYDDYTISYFDSCREEDPLEVQESEITVLSDEEIEYKSVAFQATEEIPTFVEPPPIVEPPPPPPPPKQLGECHFEGIEDPMMVGALINLHLRVFEDQETKKTFSITKVDEVVNEVGGQARTKFPDANVMIERLGGNNLRLDTRSPAYDLEVIIHDLISGDAEMSVRLRNNPFFIRTFRPGACDF